MQTETAAEADLERRFGGLARLYGAPGAVRIRHAHAVIVGLGGVGSWAAEALARSGVARLTLIDLDHIAESNINRQIHALDSTLGQAKVLAMKERIAQINPACAVECVEEFVEASNWPEIAQLGETHGAGNSVVSVIDACDNVRAKTAMAAWALQRLGNSKGSAKPLQKVNFITVGAAGGKRLAHKVDIEDLSLTTHDPLLAQLRYRLRREQNASRDTAIGISCVFSRESVVKPNAAARDLDNDHARMDSSLNCHGYGSVVSVTATFGICAAGWVLDKIAG